MVFKLGIAGCGLMGSGIAINAARCGLSVLAYDSRPEHGSRLHDTARSVYGRAVRAGRMSPEAAETAIAL